MLEHYPQPLPIHFRYKQPHHNTLVMKKYYFLAILVTCTAFFTGCQDDLVSNTTYNDGYLHFKFLFDKKGEWKDDGASGPQTRVMTPIEMTLPEGFDTPLYLHCVESNEIETAVEDTTETRGERITGEAFDDRGKIKCFGLYAVVGEEGDPSTYEEVLSTYDDPDAMTDKRSSYREISHGDLTEESGWYVKEEDLLFADETNMWTSTKKGFFYGFAPYPGYDKGAEASLGRTSCYWVDTDDPDHPTINFTMQEEEEYNKDILVAKTTVADKNAGIELQFKHVLSALKFKLDGANDFKYKPEIGGTEYHLQLKSIKVMDILDEGTMEIGSDSWTPEKSTNSCTSVLNRSFSTVSGDGQINTDAQCMMVLPQTISSTSPNKNAKLLITVDLTENEDGTGDKRENIILQASLDGLTWEPGHTYTYKISKDNRAREYILTSTNGRTDETFQFKVDGTTDKDGSVDYPVKFNVTSYANYTEGSTSSTELVPWHIEYSRDGGSTWKLGMPVGFKVKNGSGEYVGANSEIPGSLTPVEYTIEAPTRIDGSPTITTLSTNNYANYAEEDGYYDLSLHDIGYSDAVCNVTTARNTANCYIIKGYGKFKIPLVYGNGIKQGVNNPVAYAYKWGGSLHGVFLDHEGNEITTPWIAGTTGQLKRNLTKAEIVWTENQNVVRPSSVSVSGDYLYFEILQNDVRPCNLVLGVKDGSVFAWSWHIWVTASDDFEKNKQVELSRSFTYNSTSYTFKMKVAKSDLGWNDPEVKHYKTDGSFTFRVMQNARWGKYADHTVKQKDGIVSVGGTTIAYQMGRKDPFPFTASKVADPSKPAGSITYNVDELFNTMKFKDNWITDRPAANVIIQNPGKFSNPSKSSITNPGRFNWFTQTGGTDSYNSYQFYPCWDPEGDVTRGAATSNPINYDDHDKTIYDPSPVGFIVPGSGLLNMLEGNAGGWTYATTQKTVDGDETVDAALPYIYNPSGIKFYLTGGMVNEYAGGHSTLTFTEFRNVGYIWSSGLSDSGNYGIYGQASSSGFVNKKTDSPRRFPFYGFSVRPIVDNTKDEIEGFGSLPVEHFHQGDAYGIELDASGTKPNYGISDLGSVSVELEDGSTKTLDEIINPSTPGTVKNRKVLLRQIRVYFKYNGDIYLSLTGWRTLGRTSITYTYNIGGKTEKQSEGSSVKVTDVNDIGHYLFSPGWATKYNESDKAVSSWDWLNLVLLSTKNVEISKVTADLRITYTD